MEFKMFLKKQQQKNRQPRYLSWSGNYITKSQINIPNLNNLVLFTQGHWVLTDGDLNQTTKHLHKYCPLFLFWKTIRLTFGGGYIRNELSDHWADNDFQISVWALPGDANAFMTESEGRRGKWEAGGKIAQPVMSGKFNRTPHNHKS